MPGGGGDVARGGEAEAGRCQREEPGPGTTRWRQFLAELGEKKRPGDGRATASGPLVPPDFRCTACGPGTSILIPVSGRADPPPDLIPALLCQTVSAAQVAGCAGHSCQLPGCSAAIYPKIVTINAHICNEYNVIGAP